MYFIFLQGVDFSTFTAHMSVGVIMVLIVVYGHFRFIFRDLEVLRFDEPQEVQVYIVLLFYYLTNKRYPIKSKAVLRIYNKINAFDCRN